MASMNDLVLVVSKKTGIVRKDVKQVIEETFEALADVMAAEDSIRLTNFGKFSAPVSKPRVGRNPKTGESIQIPAKQKIKFLPASALKAKVIK